MRFSNQKVVNHFRFQQLVGRRENYFNLSEGKNLHFFDVSPGWVLYGYPKSTSSRINKFCRFVFLGYENHKSKERRQQKSIEFQRKISVGVFVLKLIAELLSKHFHWAPFLITFVYNISLVRFSHSLIVEWFKNKKSLGTA